MFKLVTKMLQYSLCKQNDQLTASIIAIIFPLEIFKININEEKKIDRFNKKHKQGILSSSIKVTGLPISALHRLQTLEKQQKYLYYGIQEHSTSDPSVMKSIPLTVRSSILHQ